MGYKSIQEGKALYGVGANDCFKNPMRCFRYKQGKRRLIFSLERDLDQVEREEENGWKRLYLN